MTPADFKKHMFEALEQVNQTIEAGPDRIADAEQAIRQVELEIADVERQMAMLDIDHQETVNSDKTLTNAAKRKSALERLRKDDPGRRALDDQVAELRGKLGQAKIDLTRAQNRHKATRYKQEGLLGQVQIYFGGTRREH